MSDLHQQLLGALGLHQLQPYTELGGCPSVPDASPTRYRVNHETHQLEFYCEYDGAWDLSMHHEYMIDARLSGIAPGGSQQRQWVYQRLVALKLLDSLEPA